MSVVTQIETWLKGKKTYLVATALALFQVAAQYNWVSAKTAKEITAVLAALGLAALRGGVGKAAK